MQTVNVHEAKTHLSRLLERVAAGEEIIIARDGHPVAKLVPLPRSAAPRRLGRYEGQGWMADDIDAPLPDDVLAEFENPL